MTTSKTRLDKLAEDKSILITSFTQVRSAILEEAARFTPDKIPVKFLGAWDILDLLAHLCGWDFTNLLAARVILQGKLPDFYSHYDKDWSSYNARLVAKYRQDDLEKMISTTKASHLELVRFLEQLSPEQFLTDQGARHGNYKVIISRLIAAEIKDERRHLEQIRNWLSN